MTYEEFKNLGYPDDMPMEFALVQTLYEGKLNVNEVLSAYTHAIEKDRHESKMRFEEACVCMNQHLSGNYTKKKDKDDVTKRMIHISNKTKTLVPHVWDKQHGYTEEDEKKWEDFCEMIYGCKL